LLIGTTIVHGGCRCWFWLVVSFGSRVVTTLNSANCAAVLGRDRWCPGSTVKQDVPAHVTWMAPGMPGASPERIRSPCSIFDGVMIREVGPRSALRSQLPHSETVCHALPHACHAPTALLAVGWKARASYSCQVLLSGTAVRYCSLSGTAVRYCCQVLLSGTAVRYERVAMR
jgi:hypothetical protein